MRINNNLMAMNTHRQLGQTNASGAKSMEKLSSGYRINRAGDDAAGLSISEKMRGQIRGLNQASRNAQDGISLIQTAEGALNETHAILQRMRELSVQSSNDTNVNVDRTALQGEMDELAKEITRISNNTEFNTQKLVNGGITDTKFHVGANKGQDLSLAIGAMDAFTLGVAGNATEATVTKATGDVDSATVTGSAAAVVDGNTITATTTVVTAASAAQVTVGGLTFDFSAGASLNGWTVETGTVADTTAPSASLDVANNKIIINGDFTTAGGPIVTAGALQTEINNALSGSTDAGIAAMTVTVGGTATDATASGAASAALAGGVDAGLNMVFTDSAGSATSTVAITAASTTVTGTGDFAGVTLTLDGTNAAGASSIALTVTNASAAVIEADGSVADGNEAVAAAGLDISTQANASAAIETINGAIEKVSAERSKLGSVQNRLEHTIKNLDTSSENLQASESRIRDVDMAKEMMEFTKNNILTQAAQAMLAQANNAPQGVLQLLR